MDLSTIIGILTGSILIIVAISMGGSAQAFVNLPSILIVFGGAIATTFIRFPLSQVFSTFKVLKNAFFTKLSSNEDLLRQILSLTTEARRNGMIAIEKMPINHSYLKQGVMMAVSGFSLEGAREVFSLDIATTRDRHQTGYRIFAGLGASAPAFGMIGTLVGLVQMLTKMDDPKNIGPAMAIALLTTLYGALFANFIALPIADKLKQRSEEEIYQRQLIAEGITAIIQGEHPSLVKDKLLAFVVPKRRQEVEQRVKKSK